MKVRILFTGRSYQTGAELPSELELPDGSDVAAALQQLDACGQALPKSCLVVVAGQHIGTIAGHQPRPLRDGDELMLIAPVAGG